MLTGSQVKQIREALLSAFPTRDLLAMLLREELDVALNAIAGGDNLNVLVFHLVQWAESTGRVGALLQGAYAQNPGNPDLKQLRRSAERWPDLAASGVLPPAQPAAAPPAAAPPAAPASPAVIDIFLAYSHQDAPVMRQLYADLRGAGWSVWTDEGLEPGTPSWQDAIQEALRQARCLVVLLSPHASKSHWVNSEISYTLKLGRRIIPVLVAGDDLSAVPLSLVNTQWVDVRGAYRQTVDGELLPALRRHLGGVAIQPPVRFDWVSIPAGEFTMGSDKLKDKLAYDNELPQHRLHLPAYRIARTPVTVAQFAAFAEATGHKTTAEERGWAYAWTGEKWDDVKGANWRYPRGPESNIAQKQDHPVTCISWHDARAFCGWATLVTGGKVWLPSEAEWEKAARGTDGRIYPWGDQQPTDKLCNFGMNVGDTTSVGSYLAGASPYGVLDMTGNVLEWISTKWVDNYKTYKPDDDPNGEAERALRGGSFDFTGRYVRCAYRNGTPPDYVLINVGFRVVSPGSWDPRSLQGSTL